MKEVRTAVVVLLAFTVVLGVLYPLLVTGIGQLVFPDQANGSLVRIGERAVGSRLIGQSFQSERYFHGRPSVSNYDAMASGASNLGPTNPALPLQVAERVHTVRAQNLIPAGTAIPADWVLASASGLDPDLSLDAALLQVDRVARVRGLEPNDVRKLVEERVVRPFLGAFGEPRVNVLSLNLALDGLP